MGRRNSKNNRRGRRGLGIPMLESQGRQVPGGLDRIVKQSGKIIMVNTTASNFYTQILHPGMDSRLSVLRTVYQLYRFVWIKAVLHPEGTSQTSTDASRALGFTPDDPENGGAPTSLIQLMQTPYSQYLAGRTTKPSYIEIPRRGLLPRNSTKWWETDVDASSDLQFINQGVFYVWSSVSATTVSYVLEYEIEFTNPLPTSLTLSRLKEVVHDEIDEDTPQKIDKQIINISPNERSAKLPFRRHC